MEIATYRGINCWFDRETLEIYGTNIWNDILIDIVLFWDREILMKEELSIQLLDEKEDDDDDEEGDIIFEFLLEEEKNEDEI